MSYTYLQDAGAESSAASFSDITRFAPLKSNLLPEECSSRVSAMESFPDFLSGMMSQPSTAGRGAGAWMSSAEDSHAKTYLAPERAQESTESAAGCGLKCGESLARLDRNTSSWKTAQCSLFGGLEEFCGTWPRWGLMRDGECWGQQMPEAYTREIESGYWPTPRKQIQDRPCREREDYHSNLEEYLGNHYPFLRGQLCDPDFAEWMMGWPIGWTDSVPLEMDKFRLWLRLHGAC
jgi:hypothetical protein